MSYLFINVPACAVYHYTYDDTMCTTQKVIVEKYIISHLIELKFVVQWNSICFKMNSHIYAYTTHTHTSNTLFEYTTKLFNFLSNIYLKNFLLSNQTNQLALELLLWFRLLNGTRLKCQCVHSDSLTRLSSSISFVLLSFCI